MLYLAKVSCLLLVATATSGSAQPLPHVSQGWLGNALASSKLYMESNYKMLTYFLEDSMRMVATTMSACYDQYKASYAVERQNLKTSWDDSIQLFGEIEDSAQNFTSLYENNRLNNSEALKYVKKIWRESLHIVEQTTSILHEVYDEMEKQFAACSDLPHY